MKSFSRRKFLNIAALAGVGGAAVACAPGATQNPAAPAVEPTTAASTGSVAESTKLFSWPTDLPSIRGQEIVYPGWGGPFDKVVQAKVNPLFEETTGCKATFVSGPDTAKLEEMIRNNAVEWDLWTAGPDFPPSIFADPNPTFVDIDYSIVQPGAIPLEQQFKRMVTTDGYSLGLVYRTDKFGASPPQNWADVWNVKKFPGPRSLPRRAADLLDIAKMAVWGARPFESTFYPVNVDEALAKVKEIQPHVTKFWTGGDEPMQLLLNGEVDIAAVWLSRVFTPISEKAPIGFTWNQGIYRLGGYCIIKGSKHIEACQQYLRWRCMPEVQALVSNEVSVGYSNSDTNQYIDKDRAAVIPTSPVNISVQLQSNSKFWLDNEPKAEIALASVLGL